MYRIVLKCFLSQFFISMARRNCSFVLDKCICKEYTSGQRDFQGKTAGSWTQVNMGEVINTSAGRDVLAAK